MRLLSINKLPAIALAICLVFTACSKSGSSYGSNGNNNNNTGGTSNPNEVRMSGMTFSPASLSVAPGTTVTFLNDDNTTHTVTDDAGTFDSGNIAPGASYKHTFATAGTYKYHCKIHAGMKGTVVTQ